MIPVDFSHEKLSKLLPTLTLASLEGRFYRLVPAIHAEAIEETGPSFHYGGRYNPAGQFGGLYLGESPEICWKEIIRPYLGREDIVPDQTLGEFEIRVQKCLDLTNEQNLKQLGITIADVTDPLDRYATQRIGQAAWGLGIEAIKFPSSASAEKFNVVVFRDHLSPDSKLNRLNVRPFTKPA